MSGRNPPKRVSRAHLRNRAVVAVDASIMTNLQEQRTISEAVAALNTLCATNTKPLIDHVFVVRILDKSSLDGGCGAQLVFRSGVQIVWRGFEIAGAKLAVPAERVTVNTFHC